MEKPGPDIDQVQKAIHGELVSIESRLAPLMSAGAFAQDLIDRRNRLRGIHYALNPDVRPSIDMGEEATEIIKGVQDAIRYSQGLPHTQTEAYARAHQEKVVGS